MSMQPTTQNFTQLNARRVAALVIVAAVLVFSLGVVSARGVAFVLSAIGHGLQNAAHWLDTSIDHPSANKSGDAIEGFEQGVDPDLYSPAERSRLKEKS